MDSLLIAVSDKGNYLQTLELKGFAKVDDNEDLPIDKTLYYWKKNNNEDENPGQIHILTSIIKSKQI